MADTDVFTQTESESNNEDPLGLLVGEGKKFANPVELAKGKLEADAFIEQLKKEKQEVLSELEKFKGKADEGSSIKELLEAVQSKQTKENSSSDQPEGDDFATRVKQEMERFQTEATAKSNREKGNALVLQKVDGNVDAAKAFVAERAKELGTTPKLLAELSEKSPLLFAKALDINSSTKGASVNSLPGQNTNSNMSNTKPLEVDGTPTKAYFDQKKKEMGVSKFISNAALQKQYLAAAMKLGSRFYN